MRVRTVSAFVTLTSLEDVPALFKSACETIQAAKDAFESAGLEVQTVRILTNAFEEYLPEITAACLIDAAQRMQTAASAVPGVLLNVGPATTPHAASLLPALVAACPTVTASASVPAVAASDSSPGSALVPDMDMATAAAEVIVALSQGTAGGEGNFNFAATANVKPGIPFFPAGFAPSAAPALAAASAGASAAEGESAPTAVSWAVGLEMPDVVIGALSTAAEEARSDLAGASPWRQASKRLVTALESALLEVQAIATGLVAGAVGAEFSGIDASIAPAVDGPSLVEGFEALLGPGGFGGPGTLAACRLLTGAIEAVRARGAVSIVGYSGLMLPPLEDTGLAACMAAGAFTVGDLLSYSSVCGLGLDTVPVAGDTPVQAIALRIADMVALAYKLHKPLSCRLFPVPGVGVGGATSFANPHMCDSLVLSL
ncbi:unnamed protein product [Symbiodinium sp. KB8]|nr:unnamed protein product [Symbiodinium sp. KB8]